MDGEKGNAGKYIALDEIVVEMTASPFPESHMAPNDLSQVLDDMTSAQADSRFKTFSKYEDLVSSRSPGN